MFTESNTSQEFAAVAWTGAQAPAYALSPTVQLGRAWTERLNHSIVNTHSEAKKPSESRHTAEQKNERNPGLQDKDVPIFPQRYTLICDDIWY